MKNKSLVIIVSLVVAISIPIILLVPVFNKYLWNYDRSAEECEENGGTLTMLNSCFSKTEKANLIYNLYHQILDEVK